MSDDWQRVKRTLIAKGLMDHQGVTATPKARHCRRCGAAVIAAIDDDGLTTAVDPHPTTVAGELAALLAGIRTYTHIPGYRLLHRRAGRIRMNDPDEYDVLIGHRCRNPPPPINPNRERPRKEYDDDAPPPF